MTINNRMKMKELRNLVIQKGDKIDDDFEWRIKNLVFKLIIHYLKD